MTANEPTTLAPPLEAMLADLRRFAELVGAPWSDAAVRRTLSAFALGFSTCPVELRTTSLKPGASRREASFRYIDSRGRQDALALARAAGLMPDGGRPVDRLVDELAATFPVIGHGVDASTTVGFEKIWPFFGEPVPLAALGSIRSLPPSVARSTPLLSAHGLGRVATVAADFRNATVNLYFPASPFRGDPERLAALLAALGAAPAPEAERVFYARAGIVGVTFAWSTDAVDRLCAYVTVPDAAALALPDDPTLRRVAAETPVRGEERRYVLGGTFGPKGAYTKLEVDYSGTAVALMERWLARLAEQVAVQEDGR